MKRLSVFLASAMVLCTWVDAVSDDTQPKHAVARGPLAVSVDLDGSFECPEAFEAKVKPDVYAGELPIAQIAGHGTTVKKGDVLVKCDPAPWQKQVAAAENELRGAEAALKAAVEALDFGERQDALALQAAKDGVMEAEKRLEYFNTIDGPHMLKYNELGMKSYEDSVKDQEQELQQLEDMYKSEELTTETADIVRDRARRSLENSKIYLQMRRDEFKRTPEWEHPRAKANIEREVEQAKVGLAAAQSSTANNRVQRETGKVRAQAERDRQAEALEKLKKDGDRLTVTSPVAGMVVYGQLSGGNWSFNDDMLKNLRAGEKIAANTVVLTVIPAGDVMARIAIPEDKFVQAKAALKVTVAPVAMPDAKTGGTLKDLSPIPVGGTYSGRIALEKQPDGVVPGMKCKVSILATDLKDAVLVPVSAVGSVDGKTTVWVCGAAEPVATEVTLGATNGQVHEVKSGLKGGETILLNALKK